MYFYTLLNKQLHVCSRDRYIAHFCYLVVKAGFHSDMLLLCLEIQQPRFDSNLQQLGIFLSIATFGGSVWLCCIVSEHPKYLGMAPGRFGDIHF